MAELIHRFEISYGIPESQLETARPFIDMIQKGIAGLGPLARDITGIAGTVELGVSAKYHACKHELGEPCEATHEIYTIDAAKVGKVTASEEVGPKL